ncbi:MAG: ribose-phosphate pyrophosphokinase [Flavobacteriales bacterium]|nr:MAG: ribose-phosphate pyrophosphokinase [Flavobacteriales bacterium]
MAAGIKFFTGSASQDLASRIAGSYGKELGSLELAKFSDGEFQPRITETVRGQNVFIIQSTFPPADNLFELLLMVDAAKRASAEQIVVVLPYFGFARQDRKDNPRVAIGAKLIANLLEASGITRIMTMDLHSDQIQGFFDVPVDHLFASAIFMPYLEQLKVDNLTMASPDTGGTRRANAYAKHLDSDLVICYKQRKKANVIESMSVIGEVKGKDVVLVDDIIDTAGTLTKAAEMMMDQGANSVRAICTHAVLSGPAYERINNSVLAELIVTDTIPQKQECEKIRVLSTADLFAEVINKVHSYESISSHFIF